jgi:hypothetical protein
VKALALHFPRERNRRFLRAAVVGVALASLDGAPRHIRGRWLTVRAKADDLYVGVEDLIGANQAYPWNSTPWMWDRRRCQRPSPSERWTIPTSPGGRQSQYCAMARPRMISLDVTGGNRHLAAQPDQTRFFL